MAFPAASSTMMVAVSEVPDVTVDDAKLTEEFPPPTPPGVTETLG
jgi:hypothetical protein